MYRTLMYFWRLHLGVILGVSVACAALTGALLIGDSVRFSLRALAVERLGRIDHALLSERFFRADLADVLSAETAAAILLNGSIRHAKSQALASKVQVQGIDARFAELFGQRGAHLRRSLQKKEAQRFPSLVVNASLQRQLGAKVGDDVLLSLPLPSQVHRESLFGRRETDELVTTLRLTLTGVISDQGPGSFSLRPHQHLPLNAYVELVELQRALGRAGQINALLVAAPGVSASDLQVELAAHLDLYDLGLRLEKRQRYLSLESEQFVLQPAQILAASRAAAGQDLSTTSFLTYLANEINVGEKSVPYSTVTALDDATDLYLQDGNAAPLPSDDGILLDAWTAQQLEAVPGDYVTLRYYTVGPRETLLTQQVSLRLEHIVAMRGLAVDAALTPAYPGLQSEQNIADWDAPVPIDLTRVRPQDEVYWDSYGAAPKAFVSAATGQRLWQSRFGDLTSMRFYGRADIHHERFAEDLRQHLVPELMGLRIQPVRAQALQASSGATDFSGLFIGFSLFLIVAAALLVVLLFKFGLEMRAVEMGVLLAAGYPLSSIQRRFVREGLALAAVGALLGLAGALLYAHGLLVGLRTWWLQAVGTPLLFLHVTWESMVIGYVATLAIVSLTIWRAVHTFHRLPVRALLVAAGQIGEKAPRRYARALALTSLALAVALSAAAFAVDVGTAVALFFASGACALYAGLALFSLWLRLSHAHAPKSIIYMAIGNATRRPGRSTLCAALVACAAFVLVAVGANRRVAQDGDPGAGGLTLVAESAIALHQNLDTPEGLFALGLPDEIEPARFFPFRTLPGEDISCLNLYQPTVPRLLGAPASFIERGLFQFQQTVELSAAERENPWLLLRRDLGPGIIPAIGDFNSVLWILHSGLGEDVIVADEAGRPLKLRLVGLLHSSIFQSELLIANEQFQRHFPARSGYGYFLVETANAEKLAPVLERNLASYGFDTMLTSERLDAYRAVENTYMSTFQMLGGLGLLIGTLGLGVLLLRNVLERSSELATLRACGFRRSTLIALLLVENGFLLCVGLVVGSAAALIAVAPQLLGPAPLPWFSLGETLLAVLVVGLGASALASVLALRQPLLPVLKAE